VTLGKESRVLAGVWGLSGGVFKWTLQVGQGLCVSYECTPVCDCEFPFW
jgi:hypothetical protein